jgi:multicomponent Na+:H+ antiporter subunit D
MTIFSLTPGLLYVFAGFFSYLLKGKLQKLFILFVPMVAFFQLLTLQPSDSYMVRFLMSNLNLLRVDNLSLVFGYVFVIGSFAGFLYGIGTAKKAEYSSALIYIGSALSVIFARDLITLYIFWEFMALSSVFLVLLKRTERSRKASLRYLMVHILGGLILLSGIIMHIDNTGSIAFGQFSHESLSTWLMLVGVLINAAAIPFSSWLPDAYSESTIMGGVILSAYTSKTAIYALLRGFAGWDILIWLGVAMSIYGVIYALLENDIRRILGFGIINQVGFMVCAVGVGTPLAIAAAAGHAFCHIVYKALLWMSAGAVIQSTGKSKFTDLGGLYHKMPLTFFLTLIGALTIGAPLTTAFTSKAMILKAIQYEHLFWPWFLLQVSSAGIFLNLGVKFPFLIFFGKDRNVPASESNKPMLFGMSILAFLCIYLGCFPQKLYDLLPYSSHVLKSMPTSFIDIYIDNFKYVLIKFQLIAFTALAFFLTYKKFKQTDSIFLDFDWIYRRLFRYMVIFMIAFIDFIYNSINSITMALVKSIVYFFQNSIPFLLYLLNIPYLRISNVRINKFQLMDGYSNTIKKQAFPFTIIGSAVFMIFILLYIMV